MHTSALQLQNVGGDGPSRYRFLVAAVQELKSASQTDWPTARRYSLYSKRDDIHDSLGVQHLMETEQG